MAAGSYDLGTARGRIDIDTSGADRALTGVAAKQGAVTRGSAASSAALRTTGFALAGVGVAAVAGFGIAVKTAASFEKGISAVAAVSGATEAQLELIRKKALQLGADTTFSAGEAAGAMEELVKAGLTVDEVLNGAADATVALAAAGEIDLPQAATIAANAMNQFNLAAGDMAHVADLIAGAANASAIDVSDFGLSMQQAGATANLVGLSFDDLAVAIAAMGNAGIRGSDAGTSLKTFLANLQPTTEKQIGLMTELGLVTEDGGNKFFTAAGKVKPMAEIAGVLAEALEGQTEQQKALTLETIFGSDAIRAAAIIANTGKKGFEDLAGAMGKVTAEEVAAKRLDNFSGSMEQLKGSLETLLIQIGTPFLGALRAIVDGLTSFLNLLSGVPEPIQRMVAFIVLGSSALIGLLGVMILVVNFIRQLRATLALLQLGSFLTNPVLLAIVAIAALVAGLVLLYQHSKRAREIMDGIFEFFLPAIQATQRFVENFVEQIGNMIKVFQRGDDVAQGLAEVLDSMFGGTGNLVGPIRSMIIAAQEFWAWLNKLVTATVGWKNVLIGAGVALALIVAPIPTIIAGLVLAYKRFEAFRNIVDTTVDVIVAIAVALVAFGREVVEQTKLAIDWLNTNVFPTFYALGELVAAVVNRIITVINFLLPVFQAQFNTIMIVVRAAMVIIQGVIGLGLAAIQIFWQAFGDNIIAIIEIVWNIIKSIIETALGLIRGVIQIVTGIISGDWSKVWEGIKTIIQTVWNFIKNFISINIAVIRQIIDIALSAIRGAWNLAWEFVKRIVSSAIEIVKSVISGGINIVVQFFRDMPGRISSAVGNLVTTLFSKGTDLIWGIINGYMSAWGIIISFFRDLPGKIIGFIGNVGSILFDIGRQIIQGMVDGIGSMFGAVKDKLGELTGKLTSWKGPEQRDKKLLTPQGQWIVASLITGIQKSLPSLRKTLEAVTGDIASINITPPAPSFAGNGGSGDTFIVQVSVDGGSPNVEATTKAAVMSPDVLQELTRAVRAGRR